MLRNCLKLVTTVDSFLNANCLVPSSVVHLQPQDKPEQIQIKNTRDSDRQHNSLVQHTLLRDVKGISKTRVKTLPIFLHVILPSSKYCCWQGEKEFCKMLNSPSTSDKRRWQSLALAKCLALLQNSLQSKTDSIKTSVRQKMKGTALPWNNCVLAKHSLLLADKAVYLPVGKAVCGWVLA